MTKNNYTLRPLPRWMRLDKRPMDTGEWQPYGYGYSRPVDPHNEMWRPATRYIRRKDRNGKHAFEIIQLMPGRYMVSDHGGVWDLRYGKRVASYRKHKRSHAFLQTADGRMIQVRAYRLAIANFLEPPKALRNLIYYCLPVVNHRDGQAWNNWLSNLQYTDMQLNILHGKRRKQANGGT